MYNKWLVDRTRETSPPQNNNNNKRSVVLYKVLLLMVDHDRRRKSMMMMRKQRSVGREYFDGDLNDILYDLILYHTLTAKAA
ncbi:hypothetical protein MTR_2g093720 [Medicago truncatula]|uniref:Uncharacterized protein n=1 Tax=Medicago truncatula TaxID=3880 RepID=G7IKR3_MEDTR|nr:hypothetical protein MTR_2g093720 [Medicago truncatula]